MSRIFFATVCLIIYGSLYPFHFHVRELPASNVWVSIHPWPGYPRDTQIKDVVVNLIFYAPLGMFGFLSLSHARLRAVRWGAPIAIGFVLSCCMETLQLFDEGRDSSVLDVVCNTVGSGIGVACGALFESWLRRIHTGLQTIRYQQPSSLLLLICLAAYQLSPFFPDYGVYRLQQKLIALTATNEFSVSVCLVSLVGARLKRLE